jgi:hypothetical protein
MKINEELREQIFGIIENQIRDNDPPETKATFDRLRKQGLDDFQIRQLIGQCVLLEIYDVLKSRKPFNQDRYVENLNKLPIEPKEIK